MPPYQGGGEMIGEVTLDDITYAEPPHRFEAGTPAIVQAIGLGAALDYMTGIGLDGIAAHEADLRDYATRRGCRKSIRCAFSAAPSDKGAIVSFNMEGAHAHDVATVIDRAGRGGPRRHPLHPAAARALRRHRHLPGLLCHVQHPRGS